MEATGAPRRRIALIAIAVIVALASTACQERLERTRDVTRTAAAQIRDLLERREDFLIDGNRRGFMDGVVGEARKIESNIVRNIPKLKVVEVAYRMGETIVQPNRGKVTNQRVDLVFRVQGFPRNNIFHIPLLYDLERRGRARWVITNSDPDTAQGGSVWLMATGPISVTRSKHWVAVHRPDLEGVDEILDHAEAARRQLQKKFYSTLDDRFLVALAEDRREFKRAAGLSGAGALPAAVTLEWSFAGYSGGGGGTEVDQRQPPQNRHIVAWTPALLFEGETFIEWEHTGEEETPIGIFQHEAAHLALSGITGGLAPGWIEEGGAMYLAGESRRPAWRPLRSDFDRLDLERISRRGTLPAQLYPYANAVTSYLIDRYGEGKWWELYEGFVRFGWATEKFDRAVRSDRTHQLLQQVYGLDEDTLHRRTLKWIDEQLEAT